MPTNQRPKQWVAACSFEHSGDRFVTGDSIPVDRYFKSRVRLGFAVEKQRPTKATPSTEGEK